MGRPACWRASAAGCEGPGHRGQRDARRRDRPRPRRPRPPGHGAAASPGRSGSSGGAGRRRRHRRGTGGGGRAGRRRPPGGQGQCDRTVGGVRADQRARHHGGRRRLPSRRVPNGWSMSRRRRWLTPAARWSAAGAAPADPDRARGTVRPQQGVRRTARPGRRRRRPLGGRDPSAPGLGAGRPAADRPDRRSRPGGPAAADRTGGGPGRHHLRRQRRRRAAGRPGPGARPPTARRWWCTNGEPRPIRDLLESICAAAGVPGPTLRIPPWLAAAGGLVAEGVWSLRQRRRPTEDDPPLTRFLAEQLSTAHWFDQRHTREVLAWRPRISLDEGFVRLAAHYRPLLAPSQAVRDRRSARRY